MTVIVDDPDVLLRIIRTFKHTVRAPEHLVPLAPVFDEVAVRIDDIDDVRPLIIDARFTDVEIISRRFPVRSKECARRARRSGITPGQPPDWKFDARPELLKLCRFGPLDVGQFPTLQNEHTVRTFREYALSRAPRPLFVPGQTGDRLRPVRYNFVPSEDVLPSLLSFYRCNARLLGSCLSFNACLLANEHSDDHQS